MDICRTFIYFVYVGMAANRAQKFVCITKRITTTAILSVHLPTLTIFNA